MTYNRGQTWKEWEEQWWQRHRSDDEFKEVDQHFFDNYIDAETTNFMTIAGERARVSPAPNLYNKQGIWIDKNNWDGWTLQSASLIGDPKGLRGPGDYQHRFLATAWKQDDSKTVYIGLHHWGSLDPDGNKIPNGKHIKDLGYFEPTDKRYEGVERLFEYDFNGDQIVNGKAWNEPKLNRGVLRREDQIIMPTRSPRQAPSRSSYDESEPFGVESIRMNPSLDDELTRMMFPGATYEPITAVEAMF